ncbi:HoxN/HupN/NixA family nickel/cobalt transporter [Arthrobacter sp. 24S4-2]|nr:HoxN/HupN/NixA family nickel/cobalt transporter [Arthrobacter sp. 24S4-2]
MAAVVLLLHVLGWGALLISLAPQNLHPGSSQVFGVGIGVGAYLLGMRHAFDVDHIAAIDCTTRKLMGEGLRPVSVGFWFSLGHSSIVFGLCLLLAAGSRALGSQLGDDASWWRDVLGFVGTTISGLFLYILAFLNLALLIRVISDFRRLRAGHGAVQESGFTSGLMARVLRPVMRCITRPSQMYLVGLLFGLGFDTATEVTLLVVAGGAAAAELPWYAVLALPVLFAAGMSLLDSLDGWFMNVAYDWAFSKPGRSLLYNIALTGLSAAVALAVGTVELLSVIAAKAGVTSGMFEAIGGIDLTRMGFAVVGLFVLAWLAGVFVWRYGRHGWALPRHVSR